MSKLETICENVRKNYIDNLIFLNVTKNMASNAHKKKEKDHRQVRARPQKVNTKGTNFNP